MKRELSVEQKTLLDIITAEGKKIPRFINTKSPEHHHAYLRLQEIFLYIYDLAYPEFLPESQIDIYYLHIEAEFRQIKEPLLNRKCQEYILKKMVCYLKYAIDDELYEAAANLKKYLNP